MSTVGSARPPKRQRVGGDSPEPKVEAEEPQPMYHHHPKYWYIDGNLIVISDVDPTTLVRTAFRVFRGILSQHSAHLAQRLQQIGDATSYCGCPVLSLGNSSSEIESILQWTSCKAFEFRLSKLKLKRVLDYYRLGLEYGIVGMRQEAISRLTTCFPATLGDYENVKSEKLNLPISLVDDQEIDIALFCGVYRIKHILPIVLYACCAYDADLVEERSSEPAKGYPKNTTIDGLNMQHWLCGRILQGKPLLITARIARIRTLLQAEVDPSCKGPVSCRNTLQAIARELLDEDLDDGSPPSEVLSLEDDYEGDERPCDYCWTHQAKKWDAARQETWDDLPKLFGLTDKAPPTMS